MKITEKISLQELKSTENGLSLVETLQVDEWEHRKKISGDVVDAFKSINMIILGIVMFMFLAESAIVCLKSESYTRVVDAKTVMSLIAATTVQFGAIALGVSNWLFPKRK